MVIEKASKVYSLGEVEVHALREVDLVIEDGEMLVIVGPSGSGKSTLMNLIGGIDRPTSGLVRFEEHDLTRASDRELNVYRRDHVGFVFQLFNLIPTLTALENVQVATELASDPMDALEALRLVGLEERASSFPSQLSGGQQQRVAIARAIASNPRLLLCDEPTGALDSTTSKQVLDLLRDLNRGLGKTVVLITHERDVSAIGDRVALLVDGRVESITEQMPTAHDAGERT
jgi:putative ABC transport system ATP-binding protein